MEKIVDTTVVHIALTRPVTDFMEFVSLVVKTGTMDKNVNKVSLYEAYYYLYTKNNFYRSAYMLSFSIYLYLILIFF